MEVNSRKEKILTANIYTVRTEEKKLIWISSLTP